MNGLAKRLGITKPSISAWARRYGLTDRCRPKMIDRVAAGERVKKLWRERGHPRGMAGKHHTTETRERISKTHRALWADPNGPHNRERAAKRFADWHAEHFEELRAQGRYRPYSRGKVGRRADLNNLYVRSRWEANFARYLNWLLAQGKIKSWEYEPKTFRFPRKKGEPTWYTPDFRVWLNNGCHCWYEVKGWMDLKSRARLSRFVSHYPREQLIVVDEAWFRRAHRSLRWRLPHWEKI